RGADRRLTLGRGDRSGCGLGARTAAAGKPQRDRHRGPGGPFLSLVVLLRGINLGPRNRIAMPELRDALGEAGFKDVQTYVASGNVVLSSRAAPKRVASRVQKLIADRFGLDIAVVVRTHDELAEVVKLNPLGDVE